MSQYKPLLKDKDESLFNNKLPVIPKVDLSQLWNKLRSGQKKKVWTYLNIILLLSEMIIGGKTDKDKEQSLVNIGTPNSESFNPYTGIGTVNESCSIDNINKGDIKLPNEKKNNTSLPIPNIGSLTNMMGLDVNALQKQLKNMKPEDLESATDSIKNMLGDNIDDNTSSLISDIIKNVTTEIKDGNIADGNPIDNIMKIAGTVANRMQDKLKDSNVNVDQLLNSTKNMGNFKDKNGNPIFGGINPFDIVNKMMKPVMDNNGQILDYHSYL
jgi:hypothetical protein